MLNFQAANRSPCSPLPPLNGLMELRGHDNPLYGSPRAMSGSMRNSSLSYKNVSRGTSNLCKLPFSLCAGRVIWALPDSCGLIRLLFDVRARFSYTLGSGFSVIRRSWDSTGSRRRQRGSSKHEEALWVIRGAARWYCAVLLHFVDWRFCTNSVGMRF